MSNRRRARRSVARRAATVAALPLVLGSVLVSCSSEPERSVANYCSQASALTEIGADLASGDPVRLQARAEDLRLLQQVAPTDIEPSVAVLAGVTADFARTAGTATDPADVVDEVFRGRSGDIETIEAASRAVADYTSANCQIDLDGRGSTSVQGSGPATEPSTTSTADPGSASTSTSAPATTAPTTTTGGGGAPTTTTSTPSLLVD
jgi:hypothetical protein